jgi:methionine-gamma-lyase
MSSNNWHTLTKIIKAGEGKDFSDVRTPGTPIFQTSNFLYPDIDLGTDILLGKKPGHIYSRYSNPTVDTLNEIMAVLENAESALSFASGMAAISSAVLAFCQPGDHIVSSSIIYGGSFTFFQKQLSRLNIEVTFVDPRDHDGISAAVRPNTKLLYTEPLANPTLIASDLKFWSTLARQHDCKLFVDNTFTPPPIIQPLAWGVDLVIHSATKYLGGHSDLMGGVICGSKQEIETVKPVVKYYGAVMAPLIAWLLIRGIRTLGVRIERQCENALRLAEFLSSHPKIKRVFYAGLDNNPQFALNKIQFNGFSGMLAFEVKGGWPAAKKVMEQLKAILFTVSLGDISSLICHPASTSHVYLSAQEREAIGISDGLLRLSVGIEHIADLQQDLEQALATI